MNELILRALEIARKAHIGQVDKAGAPYINHPIKVASMVDEPDEKMVAYLHDVVEDTDVSLEDLRKEGFDETVIVAIDCITHREGEPRDEYLERVKSNRLARVVKLADLKHNSDISRIPNPTEKDYARRDRYLREIEFLKN